MRYWSLAESRTRTIARHFEKEISLSFCECNFAINGDGVYIGARDDASHLSRCPSLSFSPPPFPRHGVHADGYVSLHFALALLLQVPRGPPPPTPRPSRGAVLQCLATPGIVTGIVIIIATVAAEWRMEKQRAGEPAAMLSAALEANYTHPPYPSGPPIVAFIPPLFRKVSFCRNVREKSSNIISLHQIFTIRDKYLSFFANIVSFYYALNKKDVVL